MTDRLITIAGGIAIGFVADWWACMAAMGVTR